MRAITPPPAEFAGDKGFGNSPTDDLLTLRRRYEALAEAATTPPTLRRYSARAITEIDQELEARSLGEAA